MNTFAAKARVKVVSQLLFEYVFLLFVRFSYLLKYEIPKCPIILIVFVRTDVERRLIAARAQTTTDGAERSGRANVVLGETRRETRLELCHRRGVVNLLWRRVLVHDDQGAQR